MSGTAKKLAGEVGYAMQGGQGGSYGDLFNFRGVSGAQPLLLILGELIAGGMETEPMADFLSLLSRSSE